MLLLLPHPIRQQPSRPRLFLVRWAPHLLQARHSHLHDLIPRCRFFHLVNFAFVLVSIPCRRDLPVNSKLRGTKNPPELNEAEHGPAHRLVIPQWVPQLHRERECHEIFVLDFSRVESRPLVKPVVILDVEQIESTCRDLGLGLPVIEDK
ncbi:leucine-rich repeat-containing protein 16B [Striga asiatica]|uniref:Leucine-rich repeat-containing protein 16B n=1 Tax=Striga asiatica TaxID=4170 RepID=A0A5A7PTA0_STRAF|nr:leucine-rich repeat-containing protein 16B [Striga asiatica]